MAQGFKPPRPTGSGPEARFFQWVWDRLDRLKFISTPSIRFEELTTGVRAQALLRPGGKSDPATIKAFRVQSLTPEYIVAREVDFTYGQPEVLQLPVRIAKPYKLRHSITSAVVEGVTIGYSYTSIANNLDKQRTATAGAQSEIQIVVPRYLANDLIFAVKASSTGVWYGIDELEYIDLNVDGRAWARRYAT